MSSMLSPFDFLYFGIPRLKPRAAGPVSCIVEFTEKSKIFFGSYL